VGGEIRNGNHIWAFALMIRTVIPQSVLQLSYWLDDRVIVVQFPAGGASKPAPEAHPVSYPTGTAATSPVVKRPGGSIS
jgi:hypothetical protein